MELEMDMTHITTTPLHEDKEKCSDEKTPIFLDRNNSCFDIFLFIVFCFCPTILHPFPHLFPRYLATSKVKLVSSDGEIFTLEYKCAQQSGTIKGLLESSPNWIENRNGVLEFPCIE